MTSLVMLWLTAQLGSYTYLHMALTAELERGMPAPVANYVEVSEFGLRALDGCNWAFEEAPGVWFQTAMGCVDIASVEELQP